MNKKENLCGCGCIGAKADGSKPVKSTKEVETTGVKNQKKKETKSN